MIKELLDKKLKKDVFADKVEKETFIECKVGNFIFFINLKDVYIILDFKPLVEIPGAPPHLLGLVYYQGEVIPILDLKSYLNQTLVQKTIDTRYVIIKAKDELLGIFVDESSKMISIPKPSIEPVDEELFSFKCKYQNDEIKILDVLKCYNVFKID
ncbi:chemotaxis protein CheW [Deferribacter autotrophicus]|uniref:chemotaxis protein CheW n=1 Tax=Deferribacter autotrophicus TaxID=500465 RepID=UPI00165DC857|nr:chemotaxis protein CheW [Deferribacter autotrophicus]